ncbi:hypothetical protein M3643_14455, partial [Staphylococcus lugdunensis]|nr:hypothetical protein [Staphylococcus lugdunensis]
FYIWCEPGSGRTHLLQALVSDASYGYARYLTPQSPLGAFTFDPRIGIYAIDDCDRMSDTQQVALFNLFNEVRAHPSSAFVAAGPAAPLALDVREDLRARGSAGGSCSTCRRRPTPARSRCSSSRRRSAGSR